MLDSYKYLLGKKEQQDKKGLFDFLTRPYKMLFQNSKKSPKIAGLAPEIEEPNEKVVEKAVEEIIKPKIMPLKLSRRRGKVLWKKK